MDQLRLVIDTIPTWFGAVVPTGPLITLVGVGQNTQAYPHRMRWAPDGWRRFIPTTSATIRKNDSHHW
jgi:hypothetical protein